LRKIVNKTTDSSIVLSKSFYKTREEESKNVPDTQNKVGLVSRHTKFYKNTARGYTKLDRGLVHAPFSMAGWWPGGNVCVLAMGMFSASVNTFVDGLCLSAWTTVIECVHVTGLGAVRQADHR
jgi:hypothetical protein